MDQETEVEAGHLQFQKEDVVEEGSTQILDFIPQMRKYELQHTPNRLKSKRKFD